MMIRDEKPRDHEAIGELTSAAFLDHPHSQQTEAALIVALRDAGALTISLVAEMDDRVVGHIAFSPVTVDGEDKGWFGLGPVAVLPELQGSGIGRALIEAGLDRLKEMRAAGCVLVGYPEFYKRFGFRPNPRLTYAGVPPEYFMALALGSEGDSAVELPKGEVHFHPAFAEAG
jgi:putative acetyltransferase